MRYAVNAVGTFLERSKKPADRMPKHHQRVSRKYV